MHFSETSQKVVKKTIAGHDIVNDNTPKAAWSAYERKMLLGTVTPFRHSYSSISTNILCASGT